MDIRWNDPHLLVGVEDTIKLVVMANRSAVLIVQEERRPSIGSKVVAGMASKLLVSHEFLSAELLDSGPHSFEIPLELFGRCVPSSFQEFCPFVGVDRGHYG
ncbi:hypothetical protein AUR64_04395 [Haloprofundus marisrubri]|uniref:Uncharacterized protein n=1 Tax=Haloprofundus marisrubri TaxID=1514971 RepID=A0A0W1RDY1_9EURY|nr:hypothetical protein AUR64_04395 [Haloprofundus marisrubri]